MFAVVKTGGKQYRVAENDVIKVERLPGNAGETVTLDEVLMIGGDGKAEVGNPTLAGKAIEAEILEQTRGDKIVIFKRKRRKGYRRKNGHRQDLTVLRVKTIGEAPKTAAKAKTAQQGEGDAKPAAQPNKAGTASKAKGGAAASGAKKPAAKTSSAKTSSAATSGTTKSSAKSASPAPKKAGTAASKGKSGAKGSSKTTSKSSTSKE